MNADVTVREMMNREYLGVSESDDLVETVELLLREEEEAAVVQRGSEHVGVLTERDVLSLLVEGPEPEEATVGDAMTESVPTVSPEATLDGAADEMSAQSSGRLVVTNGSEPLGVISEGDLLTSRTYGTESTEVATQQTVAATTMEGDTVSDNGGSFEEQSICEACGRLASNLASLNGQLMCADCRSM